MDRRKLPVLFLVFNRSDVVVEALKSIREYKPDRIYIAADGPRDNKPGEKEKCELTRRTVLDLIDWPCEVKTLFRDKNLGCADAVNGAITWFFQNEEFGLIVEDDVILAPDFYRFCEEIGPRYKDDDRVMMVASQYLGSEGDDKAESYGFSPWAMIWGWASWARAWKKMDMTMACWPSMKVSHLIRVFGLFKGLMMAWYWHTAYKTIHSGRVFSSWATRWACSMVGAGGLSVSPRANLSLNVGCTGTEGAHYAKDDKDPYTHLRLGKLSFPLKHPSKVEASRDIVKIEADDFWRIRMMGLRKKTRNTPPPQLNG